MLCARQCVFHHALSLSLSLSHTHTHTYIHTQPENILLSQTGHLCLTDFGLSKDLLGDAKATTFCGTPEYLAPEIIMGVGHDKAVDWWSLGILLYELTVGMPPFYSKNVKEMYKKIQFGVLRFPSFLTDECKLLIVALLNRDPKKRLGSVDDVEDIKNHAFFADVNWDDMLAMKINPAYTPVVKGGDTGNTKEDTSNFDSTFTNEPVVDSVVPDSGIPMNDASAFGGFTFAGDRSQAELG
jgi:serum/glucocorticoid-regulated kinase 2